MARDRSPNYPFISLKKAIERIEMLYKLHYRTLVPDEVACNAMGYSIKSSTARKLVPALSYYGLINIEGKKEKKISLSDLGFTIIKSPDPSEKELLIKRAALNPKIFKKIYEDHSERLPADRLLEYELEKTYKFSPKAIPNFMDVFKETFTFAKIYESGIIEEEDEKKEEEPDNISNKDDEPMQTETNKDQKPLINKALPKVEPNEVEIAKYPVGRDVSIRLIASGPITQKSIEKLAKLLEINKDDFPVDNNGE